MLCASQMVCTDEGVDYEASDGNSIEEASTSSIAEDEQARVSPTRVSFARPEESASPYPKIVQSPTLTTHETCADSENDTPSPSPSLSSAVVVASEGTSRRRKRPCPDSGSSRVSQGLRASAHPHTLVRSPSTVDAEYPREESSQILYIMYISASAILGSVARVYLSRFFGQDCEDDDIHDFLTPISSQICVTAGGRSFQTGGALFRDLPANILGSWFLGLISPTQHSTTLPWLHEDHRLQQDVVFHTSLGVGLCGCLTSFSSWNTQMVVMMDGTHADLGVQVLPALSGYFMGLIAGISAFQFGRQLSFWMYNWKHSTTGPEESEDELSDEEDNIIAESRKGEDSHLRNSSGSKKDEHPIVRPLHGLFFCVALLFALFVVGDFIHGIQYYKQMTMLTLLAPFGALLRWKLALWNGRGCRGRMEWFPAGTLAANMLGAVISIICTAILDRYSFQSSWNGPWIEASFFGLGTGFAGSLSTVSSFVKEIVILSERFSGHGKPFYYGFITCFSAMGISLCIYSATVRVS